MEVSVVHEGREMAKVNIDALLATNPDKLLEFVDNVALANCAKARGLMPLDYEPPLPGSIKMMINPGHFSDQDLIEELQKRDFVMIPRRLGPAGLPTVRSERDGDGVKTWTYGPWEQATVMFRSDGAVHFDLTRIPLSKEDRLELRYEKNPDPDRSDYQYRILHALPASS